MALDTQFQPVLPPEIPPTDQELNFLDESPPGLFPENQNSNFGFIIRKLFSDQLKILSDQLDTMYRERFVSGSTTFLDIWEAQYGLPINPAGKTIDQRRAEILNRIQKGPFTRPRRQSIVEKYVSATFGSAPQLTVAGVGISSSGIPLYSDVSSLTNTYQIIEQIENFFYKVAIRSDLAIDFVSLRRELDRITPAGLSYSIYNQMADYQSASLTVSGNEITDATRSANLQGDGRTPPDSSFGVWEGATNLIPNGGFETDTAGWLASFSNGAAGSIARDTSNFKFGAASLKLIVTAVGAPYYDAGVQLYPVPVVANTTYAFSVWLRGPAGGVGHLLRLSASEIAVVGSDFTMTGNWQRVSGVFTAPVTENIALRIMLPVVGTTWIDGVQLEVRNTGAQFLSMGGGEITDVTRSVNASGDGRAAESSTGIWRQTTNLVPNGGAETNLSPWAVSADVTATRVTDRMKFGSASAKFQTVNAVNPYCFFVISPLSGATAGRVFTASYWIYGEGQTVGKYMRLGLRGSGGAQVDEDTYTDYVLQAGWQRVTATRTLVQNDRTGLLMYWQQIDRPVVGDAVWIDGIQLEEWEIATPYVETNGAVASRAVGGPLLPTPPLDQGQGWFAIRFRVGFPSTPYKAQKIAARWRNPANTERYTLQFMSPGNWVMRRASAIGGGQYDAVFPTFAFNPGDLLTVIGRWDMSGIGCSVNGSAFVTTAAPGQALPGTSSPLAIGVDQDRPPALPECIDSEVFWFAAGKGPLTNADAATIHGFGNPDPPISSFPQASSVVILWYGDTPKSYTANFTPEMEKALTPTPYIETNGATTTRAPARVQLPASLLNTAQGWVAMRVRPGFNSSSLPYPVNTIPAFWWADSATNRIKMEFAGWNGTPPFRWRLVRDDSPTSTAVAYAPNVPFAAGDLLTLICAWMPTGIKISVNGSPFVIQPIANPVVVVASTFDLGRRVETADRWLDGDILWTAVGTGILTDNDAAYIYGLGNSDRPPGDFPGNSTAVWPADTTTYRTW